MPPRGEIGPIASLSDSDKLQGRGSRTLLPGVAGRMFRSGFARWPEGLCLFLGLALAPPAAADPPLTMTVQIRDPVGPQRVVRTVSGNCGPNMFRVLLSMDELAPAARIAIEVNGSAIPEDERERIFPSFRDGLYIMDASIAECERDVSAARARVRLLVQEPARGPAPRFLEFWLSPSGAVSGVRFNQHRMPGRPARP